MGKAGRRHSFFPVLNGISYIQETKNYCCMIKFSTLQEGDLVIVDFEGVSREGIVSRLDHEEKKACVESDVQEYWYAPEQMAPIPLDDENLIHKLGFEKQDMGDHTKYLKGAFRILVPRGGDFGHFEMWYREDRRHINYPMAVHELQNAYYQMTKVELSPELT